MKVLEKWLKSWVALSQNAEEIANNLTKIGFEVEEIQPKVKRFRDVVVGLVQTCERHENSDHLHVCEVLVDKEKAPLTIVCGAANVRAGLKVAVALVGAILPNVESLGPSFQLKKSKIRGVESFGMLCSEKELGIAKESDGILELPFDAPLGQDVYEYLNLESNVFDLSTASNRGDVLSIIGVARELAAFYELPLLKTISSNFPKVENKVPFAVEVAENARKIAPKYTGCIIEKVNIKAPVPDFIQEALAASDIDSINILVDVTNFVMLELGQPLHAFDFAKLEKQILVRKANEGEKLVLLSGRELTLSAQDLVIADCQKAIALAGVMGGENSKITDETQTVFLESAFFDPSNVFKTTQKYNLYTDASTRYTKGVDYDLAQKALFYAASLIQKYAGGEIVFYQEAISRENLPQTKIISVSLNKINSRLGTALKAEEVDHLLRKVTNDVKLKDGLWEVTVPSFRFDLTEDVDLIEEIARFYGLDKIPFHNQEIYTKTKNFAKARFSDDRLVQEMLVARGYHECMNFGFCDEILEKIISPEREAIHIINPMTHKLNVMRTSLFPGLIDTALFNQKHQQKAFKFYEIGNVFIKKGTDLEQNLHISCLLAGNTYNSWSKDVSETPNFFTIKNDVEAILHLLQAKEIRLSIQNVPALLHSTKGAVILYRNKNVGFLGEMHPQIKQKLDLKENIYLFDINLTAISEAQNGSANLPKYKKLSKFPSVSRDLSIVINKKTTFEEVTQEIKRAVKGVDIQIKLFDVYKLDKETAKISIAFSVIFSDMTKTFTDEEIDLYMTAIVDRLKNKLAVELRA